MSKMPIAWHEECLKNSISTADGIQKQIDSLVSNLERTRESIHLRQFQIAEAKKRGVDGFDADKFALKVSK